AEELVLRLGSALDLEVLGLGEPAPLGHPRHEGTLAGRRYRGKGPRRLAQPHSRTKLARMYDVIFGQFKKQLGQMDKWLEAAAAFAKSKSFDPNVFVGLRLAP